MLMLADLFMAYMFIFYYLLALIDLFFHSAFSLVSQALLFISNSIFNPL